jgi:hypothetical protein
MVVSIVGMAMSELKSQRVMRLVKAADSARIITRRALRQQSAHDQTASADGVDFSPY